MKICVIGLGRMGRRHLQVAKKLGMEIVGVFDPLPESIHLAQEEYCLLDSIIFDSVEAMLKNTSPEAIVVASTAPSHCEYVIQSAEAGVRYILCEKPMAVSIAQCNHMISVCAKYGASLAVNHQMQFMEQYTAVKKLSNSLEMGGLKSITVSGSNFGLAMNAVHYFEMFRYLTGEKLENVNFWADEARVPNPRGEQYEDRSGQLRAISKSGVRLYIDLSGDLGNGIQVAYGCRNGQILIDELTGFMRYSFRKQEFRDLPTTRYGMPSDILVREIEPADVIAPTQAVWDAMINGLPYPDGDAGLHALRVLVAANLSAENSGKSVDVLQNDVIDRCFSWA